MQLQNNDSDYNARKLQQQLFDLSNKLLTTCSEDNQIVEALEYCCSQAVQQIEHYRDITNNKTVSFNEQLQAIKELSINLSIYALTITGVTNEIESHTKSLTERFSVGYPLSWGTNDPQINKGLNDAVNAHIDRCQKQIHIIDSLKLFYVDACNLIISDTGDSILTNGNILREVKLYFRNQCLSNFILCHDLIFQQAKEYYQLISSPISQ